MIAVLPFRVATADTILGEGIAELLAAEFTGESGPRAVHMATVLRTWRSAGGAASRPLPPAEAVRAARAMGAGLVVDGSIVGLGSRLTLSATVLSVIDGRSRRATPISGSADSLDVLVRRLTITLLGLTGGERQSAERGHLTDSPEAMRAYIEALAAFRRNHNEVAAAAADRALAADSLFAQAAFLRYRIAAWRVEGNPRLAARVFALRERLSPADRLLLTAFLGEAYPASRPPTVSLADRERAVSQLPDSPEALYILGDYLYHYGAAVNASGRLPRARELFERSLAIDTHATVLTHLAEIAATMEDTALALRLRPTVRSLLPDHWGHAWNLATLLRDHAWLAALRRRPVPQYMYAALIMAVTGVSTAESVDEAWSLVPEGEPRRSLAGLYAVAAAMQGRPAASARALQSAGARDGNMDALAVLIGLFSDGDTAVSRAAFARLAADSTSWDNGRTCVVAVARAWRGLPGDSAAEAALQVSCRFMVGVLRADRQQSADLPRLLESADSAVHRRLGPAAYLGFENVVLARAWDRRGEPRRALNALRLRPHAIGGVLTEAVALREEGRLAALVGDTAAAVRAYRSYLRLRRDAEAVLVPQRDSVRAALARLERR